MSALTFENTTSNKVIVVRVGKALDFQNYDRFRETCREYLENGVRTFILDFSDTGIFDSQGMGAVFRVYRWLIPLGGQVVFAAPSRPTQVVVQLTRTYKVFRQFPTVDAALNAYDAALQPQVVE